MTVGAHEKHIMGLMISHHFRKELPILVRNDVLAQVRLVLAANDADVVLHGEVILAGKPLWSSGRLELQSDSQGLLLNENTQVLFDVPPEQEQKHEN